MLKLHNAAFLGKDSFFSVKFVFILHIEIYQLVVKYDIYIRNILDMSTPNGFLIAQPFRATSSSYLAH